MRRYATQAASEITVTLSDGHLTQEGQDCMMSVATLALLISIAESQVNMNPDKLSSAERKQLLALARQALEAAVQGQALPPLKLEDLPPRLRQSGATFVTLTRGEELRGCVGALEAYQPLAEDVREHAVAAGYRDYRFPPLDVSELPEIHIEISRLTAPKRLEYERCEDLPGLLHPGVDGVILRDGASRATFLPQVWEKLPEPDAFLGHLCAKMGASPTLWRYKKLQVFTYQVEMFAEGED